MMHVWGETGLCMMLIRDSGLTSPGVIRIRIRIRIQSSAAPITVLVSAVAKAQY
jgi:hypothetical protein